MSVTYLGRLTSLRSFYWRREPPFRDSFTSLVSHPESCNTSTLYNNEHFFHPNSQKPYSLGTKNKNLQKGADGSLTLYVATKSPGADEESNWLRHYSAHKFSNEGQTISPWTDHRQLGISLSVPETRVKDKLAEARVQ
jgi:hypothetical protein